MNILIVSLDALGSVLMTTSILPSLKRKYPDSKVIWLTMHSAAPLFENNPYIDELYQWDETSRNILKSKNFDLALNSDKSLYACAFFKEINAKEKKGYIMNDDGKIVPANSSSFYGWLTGIDDELKFRLNKKPASKILHDNFDLEYKRDDYIYNFSKAEEEFGEQFKTQVKYDSSQVHVGFNTGCSNLYPNKKMTIEQHVYIINKISESNFIRPVLLGGKEDTERNVDIYESLSKDVQKRVLYTPTNLGLRYGSVFVNLCDVVVSGDSFGMHMAIALKKYVIAWFGLSCQSEIDLYDRGVKLYQPDLECSPCWKKTCPYNLECISGIDVDKIVQLIKRFAVLKSIPK